MLISSHHFLLSLGIIGLVNFWMFSKKAPAKYHLSLKFEKKQTKNHHVQMKFSGDY